MSRISDHVTETRSRIIFADAVSAFENKELHILEGGILFREISERDYGVDGEIEIFEDGEPTGKMARIQLKGTDKIIEKLKTEDAVSCSNISKSNLSYCRFLNIPLILVYVSKADRRFYYRDLQPVYEQLIESIGNREGKSCTVRIPYDNNSDDLSRLIKIIDSYYIAHGKRRITAERTEELSVDLRDLQGGQDLDDSRRGELDEETDIFNVTAYQVTEEQHPADGEHKMVDADGNVLMAGYWENGELKIGTEYNHLIRVISGNLIFKPDCAEDPYDATDDFEYEKLEMYHWEPLTPFHWSEYSIAEVGFDNCFAVDMEVDGELEQMVNIRRLEDFLNEKNSEYLKRLKEIVELDREEMFGE